MSISDHARGVIERPLDRSRVKQRPGRGNMTFDYIPADYVITLLNDAFDYKWDSRIFEHTQVENHVIVGLELKVWDINGNPISKQQFGSCEINKGVGPGDAFKGAASDALKKCATLLGIGLELYNPEDVAPTSPSFTPPVKSVSPKTAVVVTPPHPVKNIPKPSRTIGSGNPFASGASKLATVPKPAAPPAPAQKTTTSFLPKSNNVSASRPNPFSGNNDNKGPNVTQLNALNNLAQKKGLSQTEMISLANVLDTEGNPIISFEELTHAQAIQVIKAAQL